MSTYLPRIRNYGQYASDNYGANSLMMSFEDFDIYFSYETIVAFRDANGLTIRENDWSTTTGKHLNWIDDDKSKRIKGEEFEARLAEMLHARGLLSR